MKKIILIISAILGFSCAINAQSFDEKGSSIALAVLMEDFPQPFPDMAKVQLTNKLNQLLSKNGVASADALDRFFITVVATPTDKDIVPGPPTQISQKMEMTFYIADYYDKKIYSTAVANTIGVGTNETRSYMDAIKHINVNTPAMETFVGEGKKKIVAYYDSQASRIIKEAKSCLKQKKYEEAFFKLGAIPSECEKYDEAIELGNSVYQEYIDYLCDQNLAKAKSEWMAAQNAEGATRVGEYLSQIYPDAKCYGDAQKLYQEVKGKVMDDWKYEMKQYQDGVDVEKAKVNAWKEVGVAYGKGQQPTTTNLTWLGR